MNKHDAEILHISSALIQELYRIPITAADDPQWPQTFGSGCRLHRLQTLFAEESLRQLTVKSERDKIHDLRDLLMVRIILFFINDTPIVIGPFCTVLMTERDARALLARYRITDLQEQELLRYISSFPYITEAEALRIAAAVIHRIYPDEPPRAVRKTDFHNVIDSSIAAADESENLERENDTRLLEKRYAYEQSFIKNIKSGNSRAAIMNLQNMQMDVSYLKRIGTTLENERIGSAITRTTVRLAALEAGLAPFIVNRISSENTVAVRTAKTIETILAAKEQMIRDFCRAIHDHHNNRYSALVQSALYCFEHEYYKSITLQSLADELDVSKNHLIVSFRRETGTTPNAYLTSNRMKQAAILLAGTELSVQDTASSVGIPDANYFIKLFKAEYGLTPLAYRKNVRV